jgi:hypothetical protein
MKKIKLGSYTAIQFQGKLMILLDKAWQAHLDCEKPTFESYIDKYGKFTLRGPRVIFDPRGVVPTVAQEETTDV